MTLAEPIYAIDINTGNTPVTLDTVTFTENLAATALQNLDATAGPSVGGINLSWLAPESDGASPISTYSVYRSTQEAGPFDFLRDVGTTLTYTDSVSTGTWSYRVTATNSVGEGPPSNVASATAIGAPQTTPGAPQELKASAGTLPASVRLAWRAPQQGESDAPIDHYVISRNFQDNLVIHEEPAGIPPGEEFAWQDDSTELGVGYIYWVSAVTIGGEQGPAKSVSITRGQTAYVLVHGVCSSGAMWTTAPNGPGYAVYRNLLGSGPIWTPSYHPLDYPDPPAMSAFLEADIRARLADPQNSGVDSVVIVGHSLGGLLARTLPIGDPDLKLSRVISLDSPDRGLDGTTAWALDVFGCTKDPGEHWDTFIRRFQ